ncbi:MAG TPA: DsbA family protein [Anaeromyxobacteraceae bacterium]|nr:DsbA family protein [Anaeromyxobacteraceae bacterium]
MTLSLRPVPGPIQLVLHGDLLDPWCWLAEQRICVAAEELHGLFMPVEHAPLPRRWEPRAPSAAERRNRARELRRAAREPDAPPFSTELWAGADGPLSTVPPHLAVAAARMQGPAAAAALREALRRAALVSGVDVTRSDVILELASRVGLDLARFVPAFQATGTERALRADVEAACELGVRCCPSLIIEDEWLVSGARSLRDYRLLLKRYLAKSVGTPVEYIVH